MNAIKISQPCNQRENDVHARGLIAWSRKGMMEKKTGNILTENVRWLIALNEQAFRSAKLIDIKF